VAIGLHHKRNGPWDLTLHLQLAHLRPCASEGIITCALDSAFLQKCDVLRKPQELEVVIRMFGNALNAEFETRSLLLNHLGTTLLQL
jgi:hypothetical protein